MFVLCDGNLKGTSSGHQVGWCSAWPQMLLHLWRSSPETGCHILTILARYYLTPQTQSLAVSPTSHQKSTPQIIVKLGKIVVWILFSKVNTITDWFISLLSQNMWFPYKKAHGNSAGQPSLFWSGSANQRCSWKFG